MVRRLVRLQPSRPSLSLNVSYSHLHLRYHTRHVPLLEYLRPGHSSSRSPVGSARCDGRPARSTVRRCHPNTLHRQITVQIVTVASTTSNPIFSALGLSACTPAMNGKYYVAFFALVIAQDCLAFLLSARSTINAYKTSKSDLTTVLLRDTAFWLPVCLAASLANIVSPATVLPY
jgi:hypothetical protein